MAFTHSRHGDEACKGERPAPKSNDRLRQFRRKAAASETAKVPRSCRRVCALSRGLGDQISVARRLVILSSDQRLFGLLDDLPFDLEQELDNLFPLLLRHLHELQDRKSTRLNSSHLVISYAVFCLNKKQ